MAPNLDGIFDLPNTYDRMQSIAAEVIGLPYDIASTTVPYCPPSSGLPEDLEQAIVNVAHTLPDDSQRDDYVLDVLTHPKYMPGVTLDIVFARFRCNPDIWGETLLKGMITVHQYETYDNAF